MGNYFLRMCYIPADDDGERDFNHLPMIHRREERAMASLTLADLHIIQKQLEDRYKERKPSFKQINQISASPTNIYTHVKGDILPPPLQPGDDTAPIYKDNNCGRISKMYVHSDTTKDRHLEKLDSRYRAEKFIVENALAPLVGEITLSRNFSENRNNCASDSSSYFPPFLSHTDSIGPATVELNSNSSCTTLEDDHPVQLRVFDEAPNTIYTNKSFDPFPEIFHEESDSQLPKYYPHRSDADDKENVNKDAAADDADDDYEDADNDVDSKNNADLIPDVVWPSINEHLFLNNKTNLETDGAHLVDVFLHESSSCQNITEKLPQNSDSADIGVTSVSSTELNLEWKSMPKKTVSFSPVVNLISYPGFYSASMQYTDDYSLRFDTNDPERCTLS